MSAAKPLDLGGSEGLDPRIWGLDLRIWTGLGPHIWGLNQIRVDGTTEEIKKEHGLGPGGRSHGATAQP